MICNALELISVDRQQTELVKIKLATNRIQVGMLASVIRQCLHACLQKKDSCHCFGLLFTLNNENLDITES